MTSGSAGTAGGPDKFERRSSAFMKRKLLTVVLTGTMVVGLTAGSLSAGEFGTINITAESGSNIVINNYYGDQEAPESGAE